MAEAKTLEREPAARWVTVVFGAATALWIVVVVWLALTLPDEVPIHWSSGGVPDGWASKTGALAFSILVPLATIFPLVFLSRLVLAAPDTLNSPHKEWWIAEPHRLIRCERLLREDLMVIVALTVVLLTTVDVLIGYAAHQPGEWYQVGGSPSCLWPTFSLWWGIPPGCTQVPATDRRNPSHRLGSDHPQLSPNTDHYDDCVGHNRPLRRSQSP